MVIGANYLMDSKDSVAGITNADVVEALINDILLAKAGRDPEAIPALVKLDAESRTEEKSE